MRPVADAPQVRARGFPAAVPKSASGLGTNLARSVMRFTLQMPGGVEGC